MKFLILVIYLVSFTYVMGKSSYVRKQACGRCVTIGYGSREKKVYVTADVSAYITAFFMGMFFLLAAYAVRTFVALIYEIYILASLLIHM